ncbi:Radial spoke head protein 4 A [Borealophlyctis nickersoniae]|nr:Radial spoke head protein 4 A [Borealophlyctis nickersoniae]
MDDDTAGSRPQSARPNADEPPADVDPSGDATAGETAPAEPARTESQANITRSTRGSVAEIPASEPGAAEATESQPNAQSSTPEAPAAAIAEPHAPVDAEPMPIPGVEPGTATWDFLYRKEGYHKPKSALPEDSELALAKAFLMTNSEKSNMNLYDHLTSIVMQILETRPANAVDIFETISSEVKRSKFSVEQPDAPGAFRRVPDQTAAGEAASVQIKLFERLSPDEAADRAVADNQAGEVPDVMDLANLWEWAGVSFGKEETFMIFLAMKKLSEEKPLKSVRLWGKIAGQKANYIIVEGEIREGAIDEDDAIANSSGSENANAEEEAPPEGQGEGAPGEGEAVAPPVDDEAGLPKPKVKTTPPLPKEVRVGVNKYVYYVCNYAGGEWTRLPDVIPEKLQACRRIRKYFTGDLNTKIVSYPPFDGTEAQYLRCQIARISAATVVSPAGYYTFDQEEGGDDEEQHNGNIIINPDYEGTPNEQLLNPGSWVHHVPYILPQGRTTWENPNARPSGEGEEGGEEEEGSDAGSEAGEEGGGESAEPETGPPILSPLTGDEDHGDIPSWAPRTCSNLSPTKFSPVTLRSCRWPGAVVVAYNDKFANVYVGDGLKDLGNPVQQFVPPPLPEVQKEYAPAEGNENELVEQIDPTVAEEKAFTDEQERKARENEGKDESDEEGEDEEGEEGEDD